MATVEEKVAEILQMTNELKDSAAAGASKADLKDHQKRIEEALNKRDDDAEQRLKDLRDEIDVKLRRMPHPMDVRPEAGGMTDDEKAYRDAFVRHMKRGNNIDVPIPERQKAMLATDDITTGGGLVPQVLSEQIVALVTETDPMARLATTETIAAGNSWEQNRQTGHAGTGWVAERETRSETTEPTLGLDRIDLHAMYAEPYLTLHVTQDSAIDIEGWLRREVSTRLAYTEGVAFISGNGVNRPQGISVNTNIAAVANEDDADEIRVKGMLNLLNLEDAYTAGPGVAFLMRRATAIELWDLADGSARRFLLPDASRAGAMTFFGYPLVFSPTVPAITTNTYPVYFGDFRQAYKIVRKPQMIYIRDVTTNKGFVIHYTEQRVGGGVVDPNAIQKLKIATTV